MTTQKTPKELWMAVLNKDEEANSLCRQYNDARRASVSAWRQLKILFKGKSREELSIIYDKEFKALTEEYCKSRPNAYEEVLVKGEKNPRLRWRTLLSSKRCYFLNSLTGTLPEKTSIAKPEFSSPEVLISNTQKFLVPAIDQIDAMTPRQRKVLYEKVYKPLHYALKPHSDELIKTKTRCMICRRKNTSYNGIVCSKKCEDERIMVKEHQAGGDYARP